MSLKKAIIYTVIPFILIGLFYFSVKIFLGTHIFIDAKKVNGLVNPDTLRIERNGKNFYVSSGMLRTAKGDEGCKKAQEMAKKGYAITNKLLKNAKVIRLEPFKEKEDGIYTARIFIDEVRLGKALVKANAAIKYEKGKGICHP